MNDILGILVFVGLLWFALLPILVTLLVGRRS